MKLVSYIKEGHEQLALHVNGILYDVDGLHPELPSTMSMFLNYWDDYFPLTQAINESILEGKISLNKGIPIESAQLLAPVPQPASCRDGLAFAQSITATQLNGGQEPVPAFAQYPVFYFLNHHSIQGPGELRCMPDHFEKLDFELEVALVICRQGRNIPAEEANEYIGGYMIMNNVSARRLQMEEMLLNLGAAKSKDFATVVGPWLVTPDELEVFKVDAGEGHTGNNYNLDMKCLINGVEVSSGNMADMQWTFAEIIERCAYGADIYPGDIIGSGTVSSGCFLELNENGKRIDTAYQEQWLQEGDIIEMEIEGLGVLASTIVAEESDFSLFAKKKNV